MMKNLQKDIRRIKEVMGILDEQKLTLEADIKGYIERNIDTFKTKIKTMLLDKDKSDKILDPYVIIDKFKAYLISRIPDILSQLKTGQGGDKFALDSYNALKGIISKEIEDMGMIKKGIIKLAVGNKDAAINKMKNTDISGYIRTFGDVLDFAYAIGYRDEIKPYEDNLFKWMTSNNKWVNNNEGSIKNGIINIIVSKLYS